MVRHEKHTNVSIQVDPLRDYRGDVLALALFQGSNKLPEAYQSLDHSLKGVVSEYIRLGDFKGKANETTVLYPSAKSPCKRIMLVGLGEKGKFTLNVLRQAAGTAVRRAEKHGASRVGLALHNLLDDHWDPADVAQVVAEGTVIGRYDYQDYITPKDKNDKRASVLQAAILEPKAARATKMNRGLKIGLALGESQNRTRSIANMPGNELSPPVLAGLAQKIARQSGLRCRIFDDRQLTKMKMNAILAVGGGSAEKPRLIVLEYRGRKGWGGAASPDVIVVGKAITFDTGGICLKPADKMDTMKFDKSGGCAVLGVMAAATKLKLPLNIIGLIPAAENMPSSTSYRPGDIIRTYSGKTVEIVNTDAEGRMILCDALAYGRAMKPRVIIDIATLTGACVIALGSHHAGLFSNNDDLRRDIEKVSQKSGEAVWPMPSGSEYLEQVRSKVADLKNVGGREGGSCTAAAFLGEFVGDIPWAHLDIAGTADTDKEKPWRAPGATGFSVRLILEYLLTIKNKK